MMMEFDGYATGKTTSPTSKFLKRDTNTINTESLVVNKSIYSMMKSGFLIIAVVTLMAVASNVAAQKEQTLDRETIEWILQNIDAECKDEMQNAMANQGDLSDKCKFTIQKMMMDKASGSANTQTNAEPVSLVADPITHVFLFLGVLFAGLGFYSYYAYDAKHKAGLLKKKDTSKKGKKWQKRNKVPVSIGD